ncbi:MAG: amidohydrolase [Flavobacteriia bacterium]|nr:amidohydrolase [Flavobacteriia bacterium]
MQMRLLPFSLLFVAAVFHFFLLGQQRPLNGIQETKGNKYALTHVDVYVNPGEKIENATLLIEDQKIKEIGKWIAVPKDYVEVNRQGMTVLPAFIELYTDLGVQKASSNYHSNYPQIETSKNGDGYWNEAIHPETRAIDILNIEAKQKTEWQQIGFGFMVPHQMDGIVRGTAPLVSLSENEIFESTLATDIASYYSFSKGVSKQSYPSSLMGSIALLRQGFYDLKYFQNHPEASMGKVCMQAWSQQEKSVHFFKIDDKWDVYRANNIAKEFSTPFIYITSGNDYAVAEKIRTLNPRLVVPINFPKPFNIADPYVARNIPLSDLKHWELAPYNFRILIENQIPVAITSFGTPASDFWKNIRKMIQLGTNPMDVLAGLTLTPATFLNQSSNMGSLDTGKFASFTIFSKDPFLFEAETIESWQLGQPITLKIPPAQNVLGNFNLTLNDLKLMLQLSGDPIKPAAKLTMYKEFWDKKLKIFKQDSSICNVTFSLLDKDVSMQFSLPDNPGLSYLLHGKINGNGGVWEGDVRYPDGTWGQWAAIRRFKAKDTTQVAKKVTHEIPNIWLPNMAFGHQNLLPNTPLVFENVTIWTNETYGIIESGYVCTENGKITYVGKNRIGFPAGAKFVNGKGLHLTSGIIDEHSHIAIARGVNEGGQVVSAEVSISDVVSPDDISIYRQLAGGVTAAQLLHGSANVIGGQSALIKLRWGRSPEEMKIDNAPGFIKFALGENVKQSNWGDHSVVRFPQTRMGVEQVLYDAFYRAKKYKLEWDNYRNCVQCTPKNMPRKDLELETLNEILEGKRNITCHSYVQSEINMLMKVADSMGFKVNTFTHILEGYKVADKMAAHGAGGSTFADWWAYKFEVNEAIPYNAALMNEMGVVVAINSDDAEMGRRLNQEAAKTIKYGGVDEIEAWKMVTLNPAKLLHLDNRMGSVKEGKDADLVLWSSNPLSIEAKVLMNVIDGQIYYSIENDALLQKQNETEKMRIISKMLAKDIQMEPKQPFFKRKPKHFHCDTMGEEGSELENLH